MTVQAVGAFLDLVSRTRSGRGTKTYATNLARQMARKTVDAACEPDHGRQALVVCFPRTFIPLHNRWNQKHPAEYDCDDFHGCRAVSDLVLQKLQGLSQMIEGFRWAYFATKVSG